MKSRNPKRAGISIALVLLTQASMQLLDMMLPIAAIALPGQSPDQVADWIKTNPVLRPAQGERLLVRKSDTPSRRFQFQASIMTPGLMERRGNINLIRSEQIRFFDIVNGVTKSRLEESLRSIYDPEVMRDYAKAEVVYAYPTATMIRRSQAKNASPLLSALQGELRQGKKYAYWVELLQTNRGIANSGQITIFELEALPSLEQKLRDREKL